MIEHCSVDPLFSHLENLNGHDSVKRRLDFEGEM